MELSTNLKQSIENRLSRNIKRVSSVSGGSINDVYRLETGKENFLLKVNDKRNYPNTFQLESDGLAAIRLTNTISVPDTLFTGEIDNESYLILQWIHSGYNTPMSSRKLGELLAQMHRNTSAAFGFDTDNYMGSLKQSNARDAKWDSFFIEARLKPMVKMAAEKQLLNSNDETLFEKLYLRLPDLFPEEPPVLTHGDLWSGNYMVDTNEQPYLIDPAVCYGNRECEIAITKLFGGFDADFYDSYISNYPLQPGWQQRVDLWNLYPLLIHLNLFGDGYVAQVRRCLAKYI